jgi:hypothetical protein
VVSGKVMAADVVTLDSADTVQGKPVTITVEGDKVMVNDAQVIITDIEASNGVIHVIDTVILPPEDQMMPETGAAAPLASIVLMALGSLAVIGGAGAAVYTRSR